MSDGFARLDGTLDQVWRRLETGAGRPGYAVALATATADGAGAAARMVILRTADRRDATVGFFTDTASQKYAELTGRPEATMLIWDPADFLQIRLWARFAALPAGQTDKLWRALPDRVRDRYGGAPPPGRPLAAAQSHLPRGERSRFAAMQGEISAIETLHLGDGLHRRALFARDRGFRGQWLAP